MKNTIDAPYLDQSAAPETAIGTKQIFLPTFGIAAEYAISPHVLFRVDASGFGIPHKADIWDAAATISYRRGAFEFLGGGKAFHFKTSPNSTEYLVDTRARLSVCAGTGPFRDSEAGRRSEKLLQCRKRRHNDPSARNSGNSTVVACRKI
jgi:hypothetical protein